MLLPNRIALVTGAAGRLGHATAVALRAEGAAVVLADLDGPRVQDVASRLGEQEGPPVAAVAGDVSQPDDAARMFEEGRQALGEIDILVTFAGIFPNRPLLDMSVEEWDRVFAINTRGTMLMCQAAARRWVEQDIKGAIVTVSSGAARSARAGGSHYCSSKAAVSMMTEVFAIELGPYGIRVNAVAPGLIIDNVASAKDESLHPYVNMMLEATPLRRTGDPREIADAVVFLASDKSSWTTGTIFEITGGSHCGRTHMPFSGNMR